MEKAEFQVELTAGQCCNYRGQSKYRQAPESDGVSFLKDSISFMDN